MTVETFEDARLLDGAGLHELLDSARPEQRVWAVWALALRSTGNLGELAGRVVRDPNAGVRRVLSIVLAGHGAMDPLVDLALHDTDGRVRATASELVVRMYT